MISTLRISRLGTLLAFALILIAGCRNRTTDLGESVNKSATNGQRQSTYPLPRAALQQVTLNVTGMS